LSALAQDSGISYVLDLKSWKQLCVREKNSQVKQFIQFTSQFIPRASENGLRSTGPRTVQIKFIFWIIFVRLAELKSRVPQKSAGSKYRDAAFMHQLVNYNVAAS